MKPVYQDHFGMPAGNCWEACIASIIECDLSEVPYVRTKDDADRTNAVMEFVISRGWQLIEVKLIDELGPLCGRVPDDYYILCGTIENGLGHTVVAKGNIIVHNPNMNEYARLTTVCAYQILIRTSQEFDLLPLQHYEGEVRR